MKPICQGQAGPAVEDVQQRLTTLGYRIARAELDSSTFGPTTLSAVRSFRNDEGMPSADEVDDRAWEALVAATYKMGDRTLYLRLPYFHGSDVSHLQMTLNVLGFSCGAVDGYYGPHTEAAVREFQGNAGLYADGMAFQDTFDAIDRLHHVWMGKTASPEFSVPHSGLVRAADVLERTRILASGDDPIARSLVSRMWNVACATTSSALFTLIDPLHIEGMGAGAGSSAAASDGEISADLLLMVSTTSLDPSSAGLYKDGTLNVVAPDVDMLPGRVSAALHAMPECASGPRRLRVELPSLNSYDGSVADRMVQTAAIKLLDALCAGLSEDE